METDYQIHERLKQIAERIKQIEPQPPRISAEQLADAIRIEAKRARRKPK